MSGSERAWAQVSDAVDSMVDVARKGEMTTRELALQLIEMQPERADLEARLMMMAAVAATALQRLAAYEKG